MIRDEKNRRKKREKINRRYEYDRQKEITL
jgi:hypothetical protein